MCTNIFLLLGICKVLKIPWLCSKMSCLQRLGYKLCFMICNCLWQLSLKWIIEAAANQINCHLAVSALHVRGSSSTIWKLLQNILLLQRNIILLTNVIYSKNGRIYIQLFSNTTWIHDEISLAFSTNSALIVDPLEEKHPYASCTY